MKWSNKRIRGVSSFLLVDTGSEKFPLKLSKIRILRTTLEDVDPELYRHKVGSSSRSWNDWTFCPWQKGNKKKQSKLCDKFLRGDKYDVYFILLLNVWILNSFNFESRWPIGCGVHGWFFWEASDGGTGGRKEECMARHLITTYRAYIKSNQVIW